MYLLDLHYTVLKHTGIPIWRVLCARQAIPPGFGNLLLAPQAKYQYDPAKDQKFVLIFDDNRNSICLSDYNSIACVPSVGPRHRGWS